MADDQDPYAIIQEIERVTEDVKRVMAKANRQWRAGGNSPNTIRDMRSAYRKLLKAVQ